MENKRLLDYIFLNKRMIFGVLLLIVFASALAQATPYFQGLIVDNAILSSSVSAMISLTLVFVLVLVLDAIARGVLTISLTSLGYDISTQIRAGTFRGMLRQPLNFFEANNSGYIIQSTNSFVHYLGKTLASGINNLAIGASRFLIVFVYICALNFKLGLILGGLYLAICFVMALYAKQIHTKNKELKKIQLRRNSLILENLNGIETYLAYDNGKDYMSHYINTNKEYGKVRTRYYWFFNTLSPLTDFLACLGTILIYQIAVGDIYGLLEVGVIVSVLTYAARATQPMEMISNGLGKIFGAKTTLELVNNLNAPGTQGKKQNRPRNLDIRCENLCFEDPIQGAKIQNLNLEIPFGQKIKIVGRQGLGKTAFSHLLCGLYTPSKGKIFIGESDISTLSQSAISKTISIASDEVGIFRGSIFQNVKFADRKASDKRVRDAIKKSGLMPFVNKLPEKENTIISEHSLSESEKQLIAFARVLLKDAKIVVFDEFARDLSPVLRKRFFKKLEGFSKGRTIIYISQEKAPEFKFDKTIRFRGNGLVF